MFLHLSSPRVLVPWTLRGKKSLLERPFLFSIIFQDSFLSSSAFMTSFFRLNLCSSVCYFGVRNKAGSVDGRSLGLCHCCAALPFPRTEACTGLGLVWDLAFVHVACRRGCGSAPCSGMHHSGNFFFFYLDPTFFFFSRSLLIYFQ